MCRSSSILECKSVRDAYLQAIINVEVAPYWNVNRIMNVEETKTKK